jgi:hypothetical protein
MSASKIGSTVKDNSQCVVRQVRRSIDIDGKVWKAGSWGVKLSK